MDRPLTAPSAPVAPRPVHDFYARRGTARWIGRGLRLLRGVAPGLALRTALRLFFTPLPSKLAARARPVPPGWTIEHLPFEGTRLAVWRRVEAKPGRPSVLLVHGWAGDALQLRHLAEAVGQAGFEPVLVEFPGHGRSDGWRSTLPQFARALFAVQARLGPWHGVVAHSLGALAVAHAAARGLAAGRLVLVAAPMPPAVVIEGFGQAFGLGTALSARMRAAIEAAEGVPLQAFEPAWLGAQVRQPALVVHDEDDRAAPIAWGHRLADALPGARWLPTRGLGHRRVLDDEGVARAVVGFLTEGDFH